MDNKQLTNIETELYEVINAVYNCETMKEQAGFALLDGDAKIMHDLIESSMRLSKALRKEHDEMNRLKDENAELLEKVANARKALE